MFRQGRFRVKQNLGGLLFHLNSFRVRCSLGFTFLAACGHRGCFERFLLRMLCFPLFVMNFFFYHIGSISWLWTEFLDPFRVFGRRGCLWQVRLCIHGSFVPAHWLCGGSHVLVLTIIPAPASVFFLWSGLGTLMVAVGTLTIGATALLRGLFWARQKHVLGFAVESLHTNVDITSQARVRKINVSL